MVKTKKYTYIDSLRGYAVLLVLFTHIYSHACHKDQTIYLANFWIQCRMGVMLFFMISALTLFLSLDKKGKEEKYPIKNFFVRRFFRIAPLFYIVSLYYLIFNKYTLLTILACFTFTNDLMPNLAEGMFGVSWTIGVEMLFYLLIPILFKYIKNINGAIFFFCISLIVSVILKYFFLHSLTSYFSYSTLLGYTYYWLPAQLPVFSLGIITYFLLFKTDYNNAAKSLFKRNTGYFLIFAGAYFFIVLSYSSKLFITENVAFSFTLMLFILGNATFPESIFNNKFSQFLGKISYSFYFIHAILIELLIKLQLHGLLIITGNKGFICYFLIILLLGSMLSYISYLLIEKPFQKLGARIIDKLESNKTLSELTI